MEYQIRVPVSALKWFENGELVKNPEFSANMEALRVGINENYNEIQDIQNTIITLAPIDSVTGEAQARINGDLALGQRIDEVIDSIPTKVSQLQNDSNFTPKNYVDTINTTIQQQLTTISGSVAECLLPANILAGSRVTLTKQNKNITINVDISDIVAQINVINDSLDKKLETGNVKAGHGIRVETNGRNVTIYNTYAETGGQTAVDVSISDAGGYFSTDSVEGALQELGMALSGISVAVDNQSEVVLWV